MDVKGFTLPTCHQDYVNIYLYKVDTHKIENIPMNKKPATAREFSKNICLNGLPEYMKKKSFNRLIMSVNTKKLSVDTIKKWLKACKVHGFLPKYLAYTKVLRDKAVVLNTSNVSNNMMFVYLTMIRCIWGYPYYVKNVLHMYENGVDFYAAVAFACKIGYNNMNHHFLPNNSNPVYPSLDSTAGINNIKSPQLGDMIGLYRFIKRGGPKAATVSHFTGFTCNKTISKLSSVVGAIKFEYLLKPELAKIIRTEKDSQINKKDLKVFV